MKESVIWKIRTLIYILAITTCLVSIGVAHYKTDTENTEPDSSEFWPPDIVPHPHLYQTLCKLCPFSFRLSQSIISRLLVFCVSCNLPLVFPLVKFINQIFLFKEFRGQIKEIKGQIKDDDKLKKDISKQGKKK